MADPLARSEEAFAQHRQAWVGGGADTPGSRLGDATRIVLVRHVDGSQDASQAFAAAGLPWPKRVGELQSAGALLVARRQPEEVTVTGSDTEALDALLAAFTPGRIADGLAIDLSHGLATVELHGPRLDAWLAHLVDASSIPRPGTAARCRLVDIAVLLLRPSAERVQLVVDRALLPYLADWLVFTHGGAFGGS